MGFHPRMARWSWPGTRMGGARSHEQGSRQAGISGRSVCTCDRCSRFIEQQNRCPRALDAHRRLRQVQQLAHAPHSLIALDSAAAKRHARRQGALAPARCPRRPGWPPAGLLGAWNGRCCRTGGDERHSRRPRAAGEHRQSSGGGGGACRLALSYLPPVAFALAPWPCSLGAQLPPTA